MVRTSTNSNEVYAVVEKKLGGGLLSVKCIDGIPRQCRIRGKFKSKKKEFADVGSWILVGLYDFDKTNSKGDLLEIYTQKDVHDLQKMDGNWHVLGAEKQESVDHVMEKAATTIDLPMDINIDDI
jgi:initiation factor 1A